MACGTCGDRRRTMHERRTAATSTTRRPVGSNALTAGAKPRYLVVRNQLARDGKRFSTLTAAQDYAQATGGIIRQL